MADPKASVANPYTVFAAIRQSLVVHACCHHKQMILANLRVRGASFSIPFLWGSALGLAGEFDR